MNETEARSALMKIREIFDMAVGSYVLLTHEPSRRELSRYVVRYNDIGQFLATETGDHLEGRGPSYQIGFRDTDYGAAGLALIERSTRQCVIESFDLVRRFAKGTPAWDELAEEPWFDLVLHYRNSVAHNGRWDLRKAKNLPIAFLGLHVDAPMDGQSIEGFLNLYKARQLMAMMELFVCGHRQRP